MKQIVTACTSVLLLCSAAAHSEVTCDNENANVPASTPTASFERHDDGTATDTTTGLVWMRCALGQEWHSVDETCIGDADEDYDWKAALDAAQDKEFAGHTDWRLPNKNELESIVERRCSSPAINAAVFPDAPAAWFWSSSPYANNTSAAWAVDFDGGNVLWSSRLLNDQVRLVRAGQ